MKRSKMLLGLCALMLAVAGAYATKASYRATTGWYNNAGTPTQTTVNKDCIVGATGCLGTSGPAAGLQLYADRNFQQPLQEQ